jgi:hypothetical protein
MHFDRLLGIGFVIGLAGAGAASTVAASAATAMTRTFMTAETQGQARTVAAKAKARHAIRGRPR